MPHGDPVEEQIRAAIERGEFDDLPGSGKPLDLGMDDPAWWVRGKLAEMRTRDELIEAAQQVDRDRERLWTLPDERSVRDQVGALNERIEAWNRDHPGDDLLSEVPLTEALTIWRRMHRLRN